MERQLLAVFDALAAGDRGQAINLADSLAAQVDDFALVQGLRDELREVTTVAEMERLTQRWLQGLAPLDDPPTPTQLLWREANQRWRHHDADVPSELPFVVALDPAVRHLIVVETATSRLYLFRQRQGVLRLERDFYVSVGRRGWGKTAEGDERTPLGVYFTLSRMDEEGLAERYGAHAFPLDYPNAWDRSLQRTGRGIWLHGVPPQTYSRPPLDSDGCVALTNVDIRWLAKRLAPRRTPVVIAEQVPWGTLTPVYVDQERVLRERIAGWLSAWSAVAAEAALYLDAYYETDAPRAPTLVAGVQGLSLEGLNLIQDLSQRDMVVASFDDGAGGWYRQHWRRDDAGEWRIAAERIRPPRR